MPIITTTFSKDGTFTNLRQAWTADSLREHIAEARYAAESGGIYVGEQLVTTNRDEMPVWQGMLLDAFVLRPGQQESYEYKPRGGTNTTLTPSQVARCYECFAWYVGACFATERQLVAMLNAGADPETVYSSITWPQRNFEWVAP